MNFYLRVLKSLMLSRLVLHDDSILVLAGGELDRRTCLDAGLHNVVISNMIPHAGQTDYAPFDWRHLDAERIDLPDDAFDWAIVHAGLHHLAVPAKGVCEMLRVARKGIVCFESRDSALMRLLVRLGLSSDYELEPAFLSGGQVGGYRDGPIPNYVYRWTEREFEKTVNSYAPSHQHKFFYRYAYQVPSQRFAMARSPIYRGVGALMNRSAWLAEKLLPRQGNQFAMAAIKNAVRQPWLQADLSFDETYMASRYERKNYPRRPTPETSSS